MQSPKAKAINSDETEDCPWLKIGRRGAKLALEDYPSVMLLRLANSIQQELAYEYANEHDLTPSEWRVMARLSNSSPMQFAELCRTAAMDKAYVSRMLRSLEARKLVKMHVDPDHKRRVVVTITAVGQAMARSIFPSAEKSQMRLLAALEPQERVVLYSALKKLQSLVNSASDEEPVTPQKAPRRKAESKR
jgi:DNA-binding MarR family transcriptional regulator